MAKSYRSLPAIAINKVKARLKTTKQSNLQLVRVFSKDRKTIYKTRDTFSKYLNKYTNTYTLITSALKSIF